MSDFLSFFTGILTSLSQFLITEPIIYFVGIFLLAYIAGMVKRNILT